MVGATGIEPHDPDHVNPRRHPVNSIGYGWGFPQIEHRAAENLMQLDC
jgi:hypothetical protein